MKRRKKKGRALKRRYGHARKTSRKKGHSYADGAASVPVRVHGTLYISPEAMAPAIEEAIIDSPQLIEAIAEEIIPEVTEAAAEVLEGEMIG